MNKYEFKKLERITKLKARRLYEYGIEITLIPYKLNPENAFYRLEYTINRFIEGSFKTFDEIVNEYEFYNCNNETGSYTAFYIEKGGL